MIPVNEPLLAGKEFEYVSDCLNTGWISSSGSYIDKFEHNWAAYCGQKHGVAVSNGTAALQVAVDALRLGPGDEVIIPSFTIISCVLAVVRAGATPVLIDCDPNTFCLDVAQMEAAITSRTRALMVVHMYGHPVDMDPVWRMAGRHGLAIIEDAAQAHGCEYFSRRDGNNAWQRCGGLGTLSTFSFFANKLVTTGEGGMVVTDDNTLAERARGLRNLCFGANRFHHDALGYNFRLTNIQAAIGLAQVERMDDILARKRLMGTLYDELFASVRGIRVQAKRDWARTNYWMYGLVLDDEIDFDAFEFSRRLKQRGIDTRPFFKGMHEQPAFHARGLFKNLKLPVTEKLYKRGLYVPSGLAISEAQIREVATAVSACLA